MNEENQKKNLTNTVDSNFTNQPKMEKELADNLKPRVLIVDDEENFAITLKDILEVKGYQADIAYSGKVALELIPASPAHDPKGNGRYDIGLVDLNLPDMPGLALVECFKLYSPETEVIVITGNPSLPSAVRALNSGAFGYIEKPYSVDRLFILLERALERQSLIRGLKDSERSYRHLLEELGAAFFLVNLKSFEVFHPNKAWSVLFGYTESELALLSFKDFFLPDEFIRLSESFERLKKEGTSSFETQLRRKGRIPFWAELHFTLIEESALGENYVSGNHSPAARAPLALVLILDLTSRKSIEADIVKTKSYLETVFRGISSGVAVIDLNWTILDANPAYCKLMGIDFKEVVGKKCYELHHGHKVPCASVGEICPIQSCRASGVSSRICHEHRTRGNGLQSGERPNGGQNRYLEITAAPLKDLSGNLTSFISVFNDLTEIRKANNDLETKSREFELLNQELFKQKEKLLGTAKDLERANNKLIRMSEAKSEFVSVVSHELRTPLTAILEGVGLVEDGSLGPITAEQQRFLVLAKMNAKRLADLVSDLLDISKIEAGRFDITRIKLNLEKPINELVQTLGPLVKEKGLILKVELPDGLLPVLADERSVFRVLMNLLSNAIKFTPAGGTIIIRGENLMNPPNGGSDVPQALISVTDTGVGIPKDQQNKLFGKFEQITREGEPRPTGTGLGLALSKELVELNGGEIWVESKKGEGSKFSFALPIYEEDEK